MHAFRLCSSCPIALGIHLFFLFRGAGGVRIVDDVDEHEVEGHAGNVLPSADPQLGSTRPGANVSFDPALLDGDASLANLSVSEDALAPSQRAPALLDTTAASADTADATALADAQAANDTRTVARDLIPLLQSAALSAEAAAVAAAYAALADTDHAFTSNRTASAGTEQFATEVAANRSSADVSNATVVTTLVSTGIASNSSAKTVADVNASQLTKHNAETDVAGRGIILSSRAAVSPSPAPTSSGGAANGDVNVSGSASSHADKAESAQPDGTVVPTRVPSVMSDFLKLNESDSETNNDPDARDRFLRRLLSYIMLCWLIAITAICVYLFLCLGVETDEEVTRSAEQLQQLERAYDEVMQGMNTIIGELCHKEVDWSQACFNDAKDDFADFCGRIKDGPERLGGEKADKELVSHFRLFVQAWLEIFAECSLDPATEPLKPFARGDFARCQSLRSVCDVVVKTLRPLKVHFAELPTDTKEKTGATMQRSYSTESAFMVQTKVQEGKASRSAYIAKAINDPRDHCFCTWLTCCGLNNFYRTSKMIIERMRKDAIEKYQRKRERKQWCPREFNCFRTGLIRINFLTCGHFLFFLAWILTHILTVFVYMLSAHVAMVMGTISAILMWIILWRIEHFDITVHLKLMKLEMQGQKDLIKSKFAALETVRDKIDLPAKIWVHRTRPMLDLMKGLCRKLSDSKWSNVTATQDFLAVVIQGLDLMSKGVGSVKAFSELSDEAMTICRRQTEKAVNFVAKSHAKEVASHLVPLLAVPSLVKIRVIRCVDLPKGSLFAFAYDPYVRLRIKKVTPSDWLRTPPRPNEQSPAWHSEETPFEYVFMVVGHNPVLEVEVMDANTMGQDTYVGRVLFDISNLKASNQWKRVKRKLEDCSEGEVELDAFFVTNIAGLDQVMPKSSLPLPLDSKDSESSFTD
eukprot:TRINITY_DN6476_c0_g1_i2.p1 TRINITY_DN6476_c0_g1~~TRINITY_DN6476_c0_g1_i2.p1  ORF type:complete len:926 (+),score=156.71 TRINITY_DN6476_c0_g1_i2:108-2885(+)